jgi:hypothetical protein
LITSNDHNALAGMAQDSSQPDNFPTMASIDVDGTPQVTSERSSAPSNAPEISLLALNATGELRYLGPSSGSFFSSYVSSLADTYGHKGSPHPATVAPKRPERGTGSSHALPTISDEQVKFLARSFALWILPLFPLLSQDDVDTLLKSCSDKQGEQRRPDPEQNYETVLFYLMMALGAVNSENTEKYMPDQRHSSDSCPSPSSLYDAALAIFERHIQPLRPSLSTIQVMLLICVYSSYGPSGLSQWQLVGLAMRVCTPTLLAILAVKQHRVSGRLTD